MSNKHADAARDLRTTIDAMTWRGMPESVSSTLVQEMQRNLRIHADALAAQIEMQQRIIDELEHEIVSAYEGDDTSYAMIRLAHKRAREEKDQGVTDMHSRRYVYPANKAAWVAEGGDPR